jgi:RNA polymerase sigma-70 factor (ECF subfamily)
MMSMADQPPQSALRLPLPGAIEGTRQSSPSPLVEEVVGLFDRLRDRLLRYVISFGLSVQDGEDIVQEVFLALFRHLQQGRSRRNLCAWTFRVAHNQVLKRRKQERIRVEQLMDEGGALRGFGAGYESEPRRPGGQRPTATARSGRVSALPEQDRRCLILRAEGLRYRENAEVLSLGAVSLSLGRSLTRLARAAQW